MKKIISCNIHDHFEIACMRRSLITLTLHNGSMIEGQAIDLVTKNKNEFICLKTPNQEAETKEIKQINLLEINTLKVHPSEEVIQVS